MRHQGTIDKFIGDAVMAFWNAPADDPDHAVHACRAVLACLAAQRGAQQGSSEREGWPPYDTRFGLHVGDAVVGNIGSARPHELHRARRHHQSRRRGSKA